MKRFTDKFEKRGAGECWPWTAGTVKGYGHFWYNKRPVSAHRVAWLLYRGDIPAGMCVCHKCDNPICVNPDHLWLGTVGENNRDRHDKGRNAAGHTHGHWLDLDRPTLLDIYYSKDPQHAIADRHGISQATVSRIKTGQRPLHFKQNPNCSANSSSASISAASS